MEPMDGAEGDKSDYTNRLFSFHTCTQIRRWLARSKRSRCHNNNPSLALHGRRREGGGEDQRTVSLEIFVELSWLFFIYIFVTENFRIPEFQLSAEKWLQLTANLYRANRAALKLKCVSSSLLESSKIRSELQKN